jgi:hypothetical protein
MSTPRPASTRPTRPSLAILALALACAGLPAAASAQAPPQGAASRAAPPKPAASAVKVAKQQTRPLWSELTPAQRHALSPLGRTWDTISEAQKRKWIALSENYPKMSAPEQAKLHSGMNEWVALSPQQRTQARLNFGETKQLSPDDKKAKWEAYQALTPEQKRDLAAGAAKKPPATAAAVKPVPAGKLATVPPSKHVVRAPRIASGTPQPDPTVSAPPAQPAAPATN